MANVKDRPMTAILSRWIKFVKVHLLGMKTLLTGVYLDGSIEFKMGESQTHFLLRQKDVFSLFS